MVERSGFVDVKNLKDSADSGKGNTNFLRLLIDGLRLQPCNPTFIQARDALIQADATVFASGYNCDIWKGFAKRGMGVSAVDIPASAANGTMGMIEGTFVDVFDFPVNCGGNATVPVMNGNPPVPPGGAPLPLGVGPNPNATVNTAPPGQLPAGVPGQLPAGAASEAPVAPAAPAAMLSSPILPGNHFFQ